MIRGARVASSRSQGGRLRSRSLLASAMRSAARRGGARGARRLPDRPRRALEEQRALGEHQLDVLAARDLDARVVVPVRDRVGPRFDVEVPGALAGDGHVGAVPVACQARARASGPAGRACPSGSRSTTPAPSTPCPSTDDRGTDLEGLADDRLRRAAPAFHHGLDVENGDASDHLVNVPSREFARERGPRSVIAHRHKMTPRESDPTFHRPRNAAAAARAAA